MLFAGLLLCYIHLLPKMRHNALPKILQHLNIRDAKNEVGDADGAELLQFADDLGTGTRDDVFVGAARHL